MARHHLINGIKVPFTAQEEAEWDANEAAYAAKKAKEVKTEPKPYVAKRKLAYPQIGDQLDMLWHSIDENAELKQKYLGVIGFGVIGKKVAEYGLKNGLKILAYDPYLKELNDKQINAELSNMAHIYERSDIISLHLPLTEETKNLINKSSFSQMKKKPIIINTSRGTVVNENDLIDAYNENLNSGFALDVFENEPIKSEFYKKINTDMNCILTPHISGVTTESNVRVSDFIVKKTIEFFN